jgi:hypothetical protein
MLGSGTLEVMLPTSFDIEYHFGTKRCGQRLWKGVETVLESGKMSDSIC